jgi:hypothetical protein
MNQANYIEVFALIDTICTVMETRAYLWGGWIPDVYSGDVLRQHDDAEYFIVDLYKHRSKLQKIFSDLNWATKVVENGDLVIKKDGMKFHFGHLEIPEDNASWFHNGTKGQIIFPKDWLNEQKMQFKGKHFHAVTPEFQYVLKIHSEFMNPVWKQRAKDKADIRVLTSLLSNKGIDDLKSIEGKMSYQNNG